MRNPKRSKKQKERARGTEGLRLAEGRVQPPPSGESPAAAQRGAATHRQADPRRPLPAPLTSQSSSYLTLSASFHNMASSVQPRCAVPKAAEEGHGPEAASGRSGALS